MANALYNKAKEEIADGVINMETDTIECMFVDSGYTFNADHLVVDNGADDATDPSYNEPGAPGAPAITNYTGGHAGAGRHAMNTSGAWSTDQANDRAEFDADDPSTWTSLGNGANNTIQAILVIKRGATNDTDARLIAHIDTSTGSPSLPFTTNGSDLTLNINAEGLINLT
jgi:hypothetical protein